MTEKKNEFVVNGKKVWFVERFTRKDYKEFPALLKACGEDDDKTIDVLKKAVIKWEFEGDPSSDEAYENLDIFEELPLMVTLCVQYLQNKSLAVREAQKNLVSASS